MEITTEVDRRFTALAASLAILDGKVTPAQVTAWYPGFTPEWLEAHNADILRAADVSITALDRQNITAQLSRSDDACLLSACLHLRIARKEWPRHRAEKVWRRMGGSVAFFDALGRAAVTGFMEAFAGHSSGGDGGETGSAS